MRSMHLAFNSRERRKLSDLAPDEHGVVIDLDLRNVDRMNRLLALGVTPGAPVVVLQTSPGIVFLCDQTELAVERAVAAAIFVRPDSTFRA